MEMLTFAARFKVDVHQPVSSFFYGLSSSKGTACLVPVIHA
jgi:hypothetical protein